LLPFEAHAYRGPAHHNAEAYLDAYIDAAGIREETKGPLFRSVGKHRELTLNPLTRVSLGDEDGTHVAAWVWVPLEEEQSDS
jgi:hypothetical protein